MNDDVLPFDMNLCFRLMGQWPASWITHPNYKENEQFCAAFKLDFSLDHSEKIKINVSADQRYILYFDGKLIGRGCENGSPGSWFYETYDLNVFAGSHTLAAIVWHWGDVSPAAVMDISFGFILCPVATAMQKKLATGLAPWKTMRFDGVEFYDPMSKLMPYTMSPPPPCQRLDGRKFQWDWLSMPTDKWLDPEITSPGFNGYVNRQDDTHLLKAATLPERTYHELPGIGTIRFVSNRIDQDKTININKDNLPDEFAAFDSILHGGKLTLPPRTAKRVIIDLDNYYSAYLSLVVDKGKDSRIAISWAEALFCAPEGIEKGNRNEIDGKYFRGIWDEYTCDGARREFSPLVWRCGRYIELLIETAAEELIIEKLLFAESRYPLEMESEFVSSDETLNSIIPFCLRTLQMSAHENFLDCPFYEQLLYSGDARLEALTTYVISSDDALARKALMIFADSLDHTGLTMSRWPSRMRQRIPSFSLWWVGMVFDFVWWRGDREFIKSLLPAIRSVLNYFYSLQGEDGFLHCEPGVWNFIDWIEGWQEFNGMGLPPGIESGVNATINWIFAYILMLAEQIETYAGLPLYAENHRIESEKLAKKLIRRFWDKENGLFKEDDKSGCFSEHSQSIAILSGHLDEDIRQTISANLSSGKINARGTIFFMHYLFETCKLTGNIELMLSRLKAWNRFMDEGFKTVPETPKNSRSDCHGWGAHPIYHMITSIAGIRPAETGFEKILICPMPGHLKYFKTKCIHPKGGYIKVEYENSDKTGERFIIDIPRKTTAIFKYGKKSISLLSGKHDITV